MNRNWRKQSKVSLISRTPLFILRVFDMNKYNVYISELSMQQLTSYAVPNKRILPKTHIVVI